VEDTQRQIYILDNSKVVIDRENFPHSVVFCCREVQTANFLIDWLERTFRDEWAWVQLYALHHYFGKNSRDQLCVSYLEYIAHIMVDCNRPMILWVGCSPRDGILFKLTHGGNSPDDLKRSTQ
jgi:hypothetical protein